MALSFLDTSIFVYSFADDNRRTKTSRGLIRDALRHHTAVVSYQVVQEFLNVATRKFRPSMSADQASGYLQSVLMPLCAVWPSQDLYRAAIDLQADTGFSFYDSLIVAAALEAHCDRLLTEDLQSDQIVRGLRIANPFAD